MAMKTPGVYIVEKNAFPNSVVEVATAVPVFIGYTQKAANGGKSLAGVPWRISSMNQYIQYFGGAASPSFSVTKIDPNAAAGNPPKPTAAPGQESVFHWNGRGYRLSRAPGKAGGRQLMYRAMQHFYANGGAACYIVSVGGYGDDLSAAALIKGLEPLLKEQEPTMVLVPDAVLLEESDCIAVQQQVLAHCGGKMRNRVAILDVWGGERERTAPGFSCIDAFRNDIGINHLDFAAAYYPWLHTSLVSASELDYSMFGDAEGIAGLVQLLKDDLGINDTTAAADKRLKQRADALDDLARTDAQWATKLQDAVDAGTLSDEEKKKAKDEIVKRTTDPDDARLFLAPHKALLQKSVVAMSELYATILEEARAQMNLMPPSAAMAGLYTMVDTSRGVWKAPANVSVAGVVRPAVEISHDDQEDLNVTTQGKSINAIRSFIGEGSLVWGARTLDGNSLDWRYINVRRTMIMLEESCRLAAKAMVFEPNVANTWVTIKSMISNFLTSIWKRGGLAGAVPDDAFSVHVGLGETMTPEDILEGILRVTVLVAITRPAEFIEITFQQQMQKS